MDKNNTSRISDVPIVVIRKHHRQQEKKDPLLINKLKYIPEIIADIKTKKELKTLDDDFIKQKIFFFFFEDRFYAQEKSALIQKMEQSISYKQFSKSKECDFLMKNMRTLLRKIYGVFIDEEAPTRKKLIKDFPNIKPDLSDDESYNAHKSILTLHQSTKERLPYYEEMYEQLFTILEEMDFKKEKYSILDIACGMNPFSVIFYYDKIKEYFATDISKEDCEFIEKYFSQVKIKGKAVAMNILSDESLNVINKLDYDICFLLKALDSLETAERYCTRKLLENIKSKILVISFPTKSLGGNKKIPSYRRRWFERIVVEKNYVYKTFEIDNEIFYIIKNNL